MGFVCDAATLERLEWSRLAACLAREAATARGAECCRGEIFADSAEGVRRGLRETDEARALIDAGEELAFPGVHDLREIQQELALGRTPTALRLVQVLSTLVAARRLRDGLRERRERVPTLWEIAQDLPDLAALERSLARSLAEDGELRDEASPELRRLRRRERELEGEIQRRMAACLNAPGIQPHLQEHYVTSRADRPVLPVRADARARVRGIVHDVSSSGTTVFIEPESVVEVSNQARLARLERAREEERILRELGRAVHAEQDGVEWLGTALESLDGAHARGRLSRRLGALAPEIHEDAPLDVRELRHPLLLLETGLALSEVVSNDVRLPTRARGLVISGPNAGGKTVLAKALGLAALSVRAGLHICAGAGTRMPIFERVFADIGDEQDLRSGLSTFSARMSNLAQIVRGSGPGTLVILDEVGEGTEPGEGAALAQAILEALVDRGAHVLATTHFNRLKELAGNDERFVNASAEFESTTLRPTYRVRIGLPGSSGAIWLAERMGLDAEVVARSQSLLDRDDRKLEALTRSLSEMRQQLEGERAAALRTRDESEAVRADYERRLEVLSRSREKVLAAMKTDLEAAFRSAREELAGVMREVQRGGRADGRAASRAQRELASIAQRTEQVERAHAPPAPPSEPIAADALQAGARLEIAGLSGEAVLVEGPDRRGQVVVRAGAARVTLPIERIRRVLPAAPSDASPAAARIRIDRLPFEARADVRCDLRGLRVDEALERAEAHLQRMLGTPVRKIIFIHGHGSGALREAIRAWLDEVDAVERFDPGEPAEGGNGVTVARLESYSQS